MRNFRAKTSFFGEPADFGLYHERNKVRAARPDLLAVSPLTTLDQKESTTGLSSVNVTHCKAHYETRDVTGMLWEENKRRADG